MITISFNVVRIFLFLGLMLCWACNVPYHYVSSFVGAHFPWPHEKFLSWSALLLEAFLEEMVFCLPVAYLLAVIFRQMAMRVAITLSVIFAMRTWFDITTVIHPPYGPVFSAYLVLCHMSFLIGGSVIICRCALARNDQVDKK